MPMLSKSRFIAGLQCSLRVWYQCYNRKLASEVTPGQQAIFDAGHQVGRLATELYPGGVRIDEDYLHHREAEHTTARALKDKNVKALFEAAFTFDGIRIRADILERNNDDSWKLIEVKSSTTVKEVYKPDVPIQCYVLNGVGIKSAQSGILHINNEYLFDSNHLDLTQLFQFTDLTDEIFTLQNEILPKIIELKKVISLKSAPDTTPSRHCFNPYKCEFWEHCTSDMPEFWVINLSGISQEKLLSLRQLGVENINDIPDGFPLSAIQERIKNCVVNNEEYIDLGLQSELKDARYPIHFLDFETFATAIPRYANTRPYQTIPCQWSDHILNSNGTISHLEYLCGEDKDPRMDFAESLIYAIGTKGTIYIYTTYEKGVLEQLIAEFPEYKEELLGIIARFKDLYDVIRRHYYHPEFHGSFSLKSVLPALVPSLSYTSLNIQEGNSASLAFLRMIDSGTGYEEKIRIKNDLLKYCCYDTLAMVRIREELLERSGIS